MEGLKTGEADLNNDGKVSLDEWYEYSHAKITEITPKQVPHKWSYRQQGDLIIAQNPFARKNEALASHPLIAMLDQKLHDYRQHKLLLDPKELEVIAAELEDAGLELGEAHKQLLLFSALAHGDSHPWLERSGSKGLEWLHQACQNDSAPQEVRIGAAALLGKLEDGPTFDRLLDFSQGEVEPSKRSNWLDLLTHYLNASEQAHPLPGVIGRDVLQRMVRLRLKEGAKERARMSRVAGSVAPICALIAFILGRTNDPAINVIGAIVIVLIATILAIGFAQGITSLALLTRRWPLLGQALVMGGVGSAFGAILFLFLANQMQAGVSGGLIALMQSMAYRANMKLSTAHLAILAAVLIFPITLLV